MLFSGGLVPSYLLYSNYFHIKNTIWALIVPNLLLSAMSVLLIRTYISTSIPSALFEAAKVDGAGEFTVFFKLVIPLSKPIIVTMGTFAGLGYWNDWTNGLYYLTDTKYYSIQNLLNKMITDIQVLSSNSSMASQASSEMAKLPYSRCTYGDCGCSNAADICIISVFTEIFPKRNCIRSSKGLIHCPYKIK